MLGLNWPGYQRAITFEAHDHCYRDIFCFRSITSSGDLEQNRDWTELQGKKQPHFRHMIIVQWPCFFFLILIFSIIYWNCFFGFAPPLPPINFLIIFRSISFYSFLSLVFFCLFKHILFLIWPSRYCCTLSFHWEKHCIRNQKAYSL